MARVAARMSASTFVISSSVSPPAEEPETGVTTIDRQAEEPELLPTNHTFVFNPLFPILLGVSRVWGNGCEGMGPTDTERWMVMIEVKQLRKPCYGMSEVGIINRRTCLS